MGGEAKDVPARVVLLEIPSRKELRVKNLFNVADCKMHWQKSGDYLCVKVDRYRKMLENKDVKYAGMYHNFEIFHMNEKQIPVDTVKIEETVHTFSWEPVGSKFAVIHGESSLLNVSFYGLKKGTEPEILKKYERKTANHIFWAPTGQFVVLAGLRSMNGVLEFVDKFCQLTWRPRPPTLLTREQQKEVKRNLKKYSDQFIAKDKMRLSKASKELVAKRQSMMEQYTAWRARKTEEFEESRAKRLELRGGVDPDDNTGEAFEEETVEFLVKEESTVMTE